MRLRSRTLARTVVAVLITLVGLVGVWGAATAFSAARASERAKRLETGYDRARYALAVERTALRDDDPVQGGRELDSAAQAFTSALVVVRQAGGRGDRALAATLLNRHRQFVRTAGRMLAPARTGGPPAAFTFPKDLEPQAQVIDEILSRALGRARTDSADRWPNRSIDKVELGGLALLLGVGLAGCGVALVRLVGYRRRLVRARQEELTRLAEAALTDSLTGLGNHRAFHEDLNREIARRSRLGSCFSIVMLDLDGLKQVNDTLGHRAGDERIRAVADCIRTTMRGGDAAYRTGGDEFMLLLPDERAWGAFTLAQRLQQEAERRRTPVGVTCGIAESFGIDSAETLVDHADFALYEAKRSGRRIVIHADGLAPRPAVLAAEPASRHHERLLATALARAVDAKDAGTQNHCETVSELCALIGLGLGLPAPRIERLRLAGLLHDVGKIGVADRILRKPEPLDADEAAAMSCHVRIGHKIVAAAELEEEARWVLHHHEHLDGSGYPDGLRGDEIPLESRIILVADAFEAMTADRPYRAGRPAEDAFVELARGAGTQFDRACVDALRSALGDSATDPQVEAA